MSSLAYPKPQLLDQQLNRRVLFKLTDERGTVTVGPVDLLNSFGLIHIPTQSL